MKLGKKLLIALGAVVVVAAIVAASVMGTIAYFTASSSVSNTFTVGDVKLVLDESKVDTDGNIVADGGRVDANAYHLVPGSQYTKDPQVRIQKGSEDSYLFIIVRNDISTIEVGKDGAKSANYLTIDEQLELYGWHYYAASPTGAIYVYCGNKYGNTDFELPTEADEIEDARAGITARTTWKTATAVDASGENGATVDLFKYFYVDNDHSELAIYSGAKVMITAVAIQATFGAEQGFEAGSKGAVDLAWAAVVETYPYIHDNNTAAN